MPEYVWEFTNQKKLTKKEFINYFEKKIFKTIRKYEMLSKDKVFTLKKSNDLNTTILKQILETKFKVEFSDKPNTSSENLSSVSENAFQNILSGKFTGFQPKDKVVRPLYFHSDKEIEKYAELKEIKAEKPKRDKKIQELFSRFLNKNQDLEINIVKALSQLPK